MLAKLLLLALAATCFTHACCHAHPLHAISSSRATRHRQLVDGRLGADSPSCAIPGGKPCLPPQWAPQWNLTLSTIVQPSSTDYFDADVKRPWGLISLDWSVASSHWQKPNQNDSTVEATSTEGCRRIKAVAPTTRCFIYHNQELALQAFESQRAVMYDRSKANWFLQYTDGQGHKNGTIYNEPGGPGDQFFWDFRIPAVRDFYVSSVLKTVSTPLIDGSFDDDVQGFPVEHDAGPKNINMSDSDVKELQYYTLVTSQMLIDGLIAAGKYVWQAFSAEDDVGEGIQRSSCAAFMHARCGTNATAWQKLAITMKFDNTPANIEQSLAAFLITRPPIAYLGYGWESDFRNWDPIFLRQVGEPKNLCSEIAPNVFERTWTYGNVTLDCNSWTAVVPHQDV